MLELKNNLIALIMTCSGINLWAQGIVHGVVSDSDNQPIEAVEISTLDGQNMTFTDASGTYSMDLHSGEYTINYVASEGTASRQVTIHDQQSTNADVVIVFTSPTQPDAPNEVETVVVKQKKIKKGTEAEALILQQKAGEVKEVVSSAQWSKQGASDLAAAVTKVVGVSKEQGQDRIYVRGLGDRYLTTTLNGLPLPSNEVDKKNIDLSLFNAHLADHIAVSKTYKSEFFGDFGASNIDIASKNYFGKPMWQVGMGLTMNSNSLGKDFVRSEGIGLLGFYGRYDHNPYAVVLSHGVDPQKSNIPLGARIRLSIGNTWQVWSEGKLGYFFTAEYSNEYTYYQGEANDYTTTLKTGFSDVKIYNYKATTTAFGALNYKINAKNSVSYMALFINNAQDQVGYYGADGKGYSRDVSREVGYYQMNEQFDQDMMLVQQLSGLHSWDDKFTVDWGLAYNIVNAHQPDRKRITAIDYDYWLDNDPQTNPIFYANSAFDNQRYFQDISEQEHNGKINLNYTLTDQIKLTAGYSGRTKTRNFSNIRYGYTAFDSSLVFNPNNLDQVFNADNINEGLLQTEVIRPIFPQDTGLGTTNLPGLNENTYEGQLDIHGLHLSTIMQLADKWVLIPGIRVENFKQRIDFDVINLVTVPNPGFNQNNQWILLPNMNLNYKVTDNQNIRLGLSQTASFAEFKEIAPIVYEDVTRREGGNPDLLGTKEGVNYINVQDVAYSAIYNADIKYERFMKKGQLLSLAGFFKRIENPVNLVTANDATGTQRYFRTGGKAEVMGVELEFRKNLVLNSNGSLSTIFNAAYTYTTQDLYKQIQGTYSVSFDRAQDQLQGASPLIVNASVSYQRLLGDYRPTATLAVNYFSDRIYSLGSGALGNNIEKGIVTLDFVLKNKLGKRAELDLSLMNLLNPSIKIVRETAAKEVTIESYQRGIDIKLGFNYKF